MKKAALIALFIGLCTCANAQIKYCIKDSCTVLKLPDKSSKIQNHANPGDTVNVIGYYKGYWAVIFKDRKGWVTEKFITVNKELEPIKSWGLKLYEAN